jgi:hypothetical protein
MPNHRADMVASLFKITWHTIAFIGKSIYKLFK